MGAEEQKELKGWITRTLTGAVSIIILLIGLFWSVTWWSLRDQVADHEKRIRTVETKSDVTCERVDGLQITLTRIEKKLETVEQLLTKRR